MRMISKPAFLVGAFLLSIATVRAALAPTSDTMLVSVSGKVVDLRGEPVHEVEIGSMFAFSDGEAEVLEPLEVDEDGNFSGQIEMGDGAHALVAYTPDRRRAGFVRVHRGKVDHLKLKLAPTVHLQAEVTCEELDARPEWFNACFDHLDIRPVSADSSTGKLDVRLPLGEWEYQVYDAWFNSTTGAVDLDGARLKLDLGAIDLPAGYISRNEGRVVEDWKATAAKNVALERSAISSFRGKWVLVDFFGSWSDTCIAEIGELIEFHAENASDDFELIAFHDSSVRGMVELDKRLARISREHWDGELPRFPVLIDGEGETFRRFEIRAFPTMVLFDPEGRLIGRASLEMLRQALAGELEVPEPRER